MGELGRWALIFALIVAPYAIIANLLAIRLNSLRWRQSAKNAALALTGLTTLASVSLVFLLVTGDFSYKYVAQYSSTTTPLFYKFTAFWGGNAGSLLLWLWILSTYTGLVAWSKHKDSEQYLPWVSSVLLVINTFFLVLLNFVDPPFAKLPEPAAEGAGLNPLLQNPSMAVHPVTLYLGYIGMAVPFAYGMAALILKKADSTWLKVTRRWTLVSWLFLSMGIMFGAHWAYVELGWGGYWAWDPVENASFLPWLTGTAFLHSAMTQERKGMLKGWNIILVTVTFLLTIFGTFLTRGGLLWSIHAFAEGPIGAYFLAFIGLALVVSMALIIFRWPVLKADKSFDAVVSKETSFLLNNLLLVGIMFTTFWGTIYPVVSEAVTGTKLAVGPPYFNKVNIPLFIALVILMGICPLIAWRKSSLQSVKNSLTIPAPVAILSGIAFFAVGVRGWIPLLSLTSAIFVCTTLFLEFSYAVRARVKITGENPFRSFYMLFVKNRRRYGGYVVHFAVIVIVIGLIGAGSFSVDRISSLSPGEIVNVGGYTLTFRGIGKESLPGQQRTYGGLLVEKDGKELGVIRPENVTYLNSAQPTTEVGVISTLTEDLYVAFNGWDKQSKTAVFQIKIFPLMKWVWIGGYIFIFGTLISLWPQKQKWVSEERLNRTSVNREMAANE